MLSPRFQFKLIAQCFLFSLVPEGDIEKKFNARTENVNNDKKGRTIRGEGPRSTMSKFKVVEFDEFKLVNKCKPVEKEKSTKLHCYKHS